MAWKFYTSEGMLKVDNTAAVKKTLFNAQSILAATADDAPIPLTVGEQTVVGRITGGNVAALTAAQTSAIVHSVGLAADWDILDHKLTAQNLAADALTAGRLVFTGADGLLSVSDNGLWDGSTLTIKGGAVFNENSANVDFRIESNTKTHAFFVQGSDGNVGLGTDAPTSNLEVSGAPNIEGIITIFRPDGNYTMGSDVLLGSLLFSTQVFDATHSEFASIRCYTDGAAGTSLTDRPSRLSFWTSPDTTGGPTERARINKDGNVGIGTTAPGAKCHIDQSSTSGAIPVLSLDQADVSDGFINFIGTSAASAVGPISTWTTGNSIQGFRRIEVNGAQVWAPYYDAPTS